MGEYGVGIVAALVASAYMAYALWSSLKSSKC